MWKKIILRPPPGKMTDADTVHNHPDGSRGLSAPDIYLSIYGNIHSVTCCNKKWKLDSNTPQYWLGGYDSR